MTNFPKTTVNRVRQAPMRGAYDAETVHAILDEGWIAHVGFAHEGNQVVIPTYYIRDGNNVILHGSRKSRMFRTLAAGAPLALGITVLDGLVLARSAFHHSMNYRSVVVHGSAVELTGADKARALDLFVERIAQGRSKAARGMNKQEEKATMVLSVALETVAAKCRSGPPIDDPDDMDLAVWAGVVPIETRYGKPLADEGLAAGLQPPILKS